MRVREDMHMDFRLSEEQEAIRTMALDFARDEIAPHAIDWDQQKHFPVETLRSAAALGMAGSISATTSAERDLPASTRQ